jgi:hypothetical protein
MNSTTYRRKARECLTRVQLVVSEDAKAFMLTMAQRWHRLAQEAEELERGAAEDAPQEEAHT